MVAGIRRDGRDLPGEAAGASLKGADPPLVLPPDMISPVKQPGPH